MMVNTEIYRVFRFIHQYEEISPRVDGHVDDGCRRTVVSMDGVRDDSDQGPVIIDLSRKTETYTDTCSNDSKRWYKTRVPEKTRLKSK